MQDARQDKTLISARSLTAPAFSHKIEVRGIALRMLQGNIDGLQMSKDINNLELPLQKVLDLGKIDSWLRGIVQLIPRPVDPACRFSQEKDMHSAALEVTHQDFNTHALAYGTHDLIETADIEKMEGFRRVVNACSKADVRINVALLAHGALEVSFDPDEAFARSEIFGASYANVLPAMFGIRNTAGRK
jgi:hypothetical protein